MLWKINRKCSFDNKKFQLIEGIKLEGTGKVIYKLKTLLVRDYLIVANHIDGVANDEARFKQYSDDLKITAIHYVFGL